MTDSWEQSKQPQRLAQKYPGRVLDFPPEETSLIGAGIGFAQAGLLPVVEIPYAKYLDCGFDMFQEAGIAHWLANGNSGTGMVFRLQGFGRGLFGGNFHTHNTIHMAPGLDVLCYSNGPDYARGLRYALQQARAGRVVMLVDCTELLNLRHMSPDSSDDFWRLPYSTGGETLDWDQVRTYGQGKRLAIVTYGNGVNASLQARATLQKMCEEKGMKGRPEDEIVVIDVPYLSRVPTGLVSALEGIEKVVFADPCKDGPNPLSGFVTSLQQQGVLPEQWTSVSSVNSYNPLGSYLTFLSSEDIQHAVLEVFQRK